MALSEQERLQIVDEVVNKIKDESQGVNELPEVASLDGIKSLPAMKGTQVVTAPISLLGAEATTAAADARAAAVTANQAASNAQDAERNCEQAKTDAQEAASEAQTAANRANKAATTANRAYEAAMAGMTLRFNGFTNDLSQSLGSATPGGEVLFSTVDKRFVYRLGQDIYQSWSVNGWADDMAYNPDVTIPGKDRVYIFGETLYIWSEEEESLVEYAAGGSGSGSGFFNVTKEIPTLDGSAYDLQTAINAVKECESIADEDKPGLIITFLDASGKWRDYRYKGTSAEAMATATLWEEYGGAGAIKKLTVNGQEATPDARGEASLTIPIPQVDQTLNPDSDQAVSNAAVASKIAELEANTLFAADTEENEDGSTMVTLKNKSNAEIVSFSVMGGGGGGGGETSGTKILLNASTSANIVKEGEAVTLQYTYDHVYSGGDDAGQSTGQKADITILIQRGSTKMYEQTIANVSKGTSEPMDITKYLTRGEKTDVYVKAVVQSLDGGKPQTKQAYQSVEVVTLGLTSDYRIDTKVAAGGYTEGETANIPYVVSGAGNKTVYLYVDGREKETKAVTKSGQAPGSFSLPMSGLTAGRHVIQLVAEREIAGLAEPLKSESIYIDILKAGGAQPFIGTKMTFKDGTIFSTRDYTTPTINTGQYEKVEFDYVVYDPNNTEAALGIFANGKQTASVVADRTAQVYTNRFTSRGTNDLQFRCGLTTYNFYIAVAASGIDIEEATAGLLMKLSAAGRSNAESASGREQWTDGEVTTAFHDFDWSSNGWFGDTLRLTNGANIEIGYKPFRIDATPTGATYEFELSCANTTDKDAPVLRCFDGSVGFEVTATEAKMRTAGGTEVSTPFTDNIDLHIAFVVQPRGGNRLLELYVNGIRTSAVQYAASDSLLQEDAQTITVMSEGTDVDLRSIRVYEKALTDDEALTNFIVDRADVENMVTLFQANDILDNEGLQIDIEKLRAQGKGVMRIVGRVDLVNQTNDKKYEELVDVYFYSPYGREYDLVLLGAGLKIQGTSSTTYPRKNYRIYADRPGCIMLVGGVEVPSKEYAFKPGATPVKIWCLKADYSDSSSTHNTGAVRLINDVMKRCGWLTPPQIAESTGKDIRIGIDGFPIDGFADQTGEGNNTYLGKFNFNNEKADSHEVYGFQGVAGFNDEDSLSGKRNPCICLEFLNNSKPLCLFQLADFNAEFDDSLEFRFGGSDSTDYAKATAKNWGSAGTQSKAAITRLWNWLDSVKTDPDKFAAEVDQYFNVPFMIAYYLFTDYFMDVDGRAKNMMLATWDGLIWYFLPYDWDTILGSRNDCLLAYDYTITEETKDPQLGTYAFAGHDSVLWRLVREGMADEVRSIAKTLRANMSTEEVLQMFNTKQMGNWSERVYNKDGFFKYIQPLVEGVDTTEGKKIYNYLYALQGSRYAHRVYTIKNRCALLDAQYAAGTYRSDAFPVYYNYNLAESPRRIRITATERYYFGYGFTNGEPTVTGVLASGAGSRVDLTWNANLTVNDPQNVYGASRMAELDMSNIAVAIANKLNLNPCVSLRKLNLNCNGGQTRLTGLVVGNCRMLTDLSARGFRSPEFTDIDLSTNTKLERIDLGNTALTSVTLAKGAPITSMTLPEGIQSLELRNLNRLTNAGLDLEGTANITKVVIDGCALIDWLTLVQKCANLKFLRVTGVDFEDDGTVLRSLQNIGGVDEAGRTSTDGCRLKGTCRLNRCLTQEEYETLVAKFPELTIIQPEYTVIKQRESIADGTGWSNLDNRTGYEFNNDYVPSGHVERILNARFRCLAKSTGEAEVTIFPLHDAHSAYYADAQDYTRATPASLNGTEGDVMLFEPAYWFKGVNDAVDKHKYKIYHFGADKPSTPQGVKIFREEMTVTAGLAASVSEDYSTAKDCRVAASSYSVVECDIPQGEGYRVARFPGVVSVMYGGVFLDANGKIVGRLAAGSGGGQVHGQYIFGKIPEGAVKILFTIANGEPFDYVWLTPSEAIADVEPDWVFHPEMLGAVYEGTVRDDVLRSISGVQSSASINQPEFKQYARNHGKGWQIVDWAWHCATCNLFYVKYGKQDSQGVLGYGTNTNGRATGMTNECGMTDTFANPANTTEQSAYIWTDKEAGLKKNIQAPNGLGYENIHGNKAEWILDLFNVDKADYTYTLQEPDGSTRRLTGIKVGGSMWPTAVFNGRYMDIWITQSGAGSTSFYYDENYINNTVGRVVYRSYVNAAAYGGVANAVAYHDSAIVSASIGSRLAFRGKIVLAKSVAVFKAISA